MMQLKMGYGAEQRILKKILKNKCSMSIAVKEIQITTLRFLVSSVRMSKFKERNMGKWESFFTVDGITNWCIYYKNLGGEYSKS